jgi:hypothetical protein
MKKFSLKKKVQIIRYESGKTRMPPLGGPKEIMDLSSDHQ